MTWFEGITQVFLSTVTSTVALGVIAYLGRSFFAQYLTRDLENYKSQLNQKAETHKQEFTKELEQLKSLLSERQIRFSALHQKRDRAIPELYALIWPAEKALTVMTFAYRHLVEKDEKAQQARVEEAADLCQKLHDYFEMHRIFLDEDTAMKCDAFLKIFKTAFVDYHLRETAEDRTKRLVEIYEQVTTKIPEAKRALERDLRMLLGPADAHDRGRAKHHLNSL